MNNTSLFRADRVTHLKIVVMSLVCATVVATIGVAARMGADQGAPQTLVVKAGAPVVSATVGSATTVR